MKMKSNYMKLLLIGVLLTFLVIAVSYGAGLICDNDANESVTVQIFPLSLDSENSSFEIANINDDRHLRTAPRNETIKFPPGTNFTGLDIRSLPAYTFDEFTVPESSMKSMIQASARNDTVLENRYSGKSGDSIKSRLWNEYGGNFVLALNDSTAVYVQSYSES